MMAWPISSTSEGSVFLSLEFCDTILCILPRTVSIIALLFRYVLHRLIATPRVKVPSRRLSQCIALDRAALLGCIAAVHLASLVVYCTQAASLSGLQAKTTLPACAIQFTCAVVLLRYSTERTISHLLELILLASAILDAFRLSTLWTLASQHGFDSPRVAVVALQTTSIAIYAFALAVISRSSPAIKDVREHEPETAQSHTQAIAPPEKDASFFSLIFLGWLNPLLSAGMKQEILQSDMQRIETHPTSTFFPPPGFDEHRKTRNDRSFLAQVIHEIPLQTHLLFLWALVLSGCTAATTLCQPIIIKALVSFLQSDDHLSVGAWLVVVLFLDFTLLNILVAQSTHVMDQISFRIRAYLTYRIHAKSVEPMATQASARGSDSESAKVTVLASVDVTQAVFIPRVLAETTTSVIIVGVGAYLLYQAVDLVLIGPLLLALLSISIPISLGKRLTRSQRRALEATERRIRSVGQLVEKTRSIRMGGMESMAEKEVLENRVVEIKAMSLYRKLLIVVVFASDSVNGFSLLLTFGVYTAVNGTDLEYTTLFTALSVISIMLGPFPSFIQMLPALYEGFVSWGRISAYVKPDSEQSGDAHHLEKADNQICGLIHTSSDDLNVATFCGASLGWGTEKILFDVSLDLKKGSVIGVTGSSGCGKSTLLRSLIGEVNILSGTIRTSTLRTAFCDQTPYFLANRTIRQNIILESPFDGKLYSEVLHSCCLIPDISKWPKGDDTVLVDAVGTSLSGGQRKRLALARALYHRSSLLILDDVFTGLDLRTIREMKDALFGKEGFVTNRRQEMAVLIVTPLETSVFPSSFPHETFSVKEGRLFPHRTEPITEEHPELEKSESKESPAQPSLKIEPNENSSASRAQDKNRKSESSNATPNDRAPTTPAKKHVALRDLATYLKSFGLFNLIISLLATCGASGINKASAFFLSYWAGRYEAGDFSKTPEFYMGMYSLIIGSGFVCILVTCGFFFLRMIPKSAVSIHKDMLHVLVSSPANFLESKGPETLNRFTNDVNVLDLALPLAILNSIWAVAAVLGSMGVLAAGSVYTLISLAISLVVLYFIQRRYLATSSQLRTLQIASQAPVIGTLRASCDGRATIRAFNLQDSACSTLVDQVYQASKSAYLFKSLQAWLFLVIGLLAGGVAGTLAALLVGLKSTVNVGWAGVALVNTITLGSDLKMLMNWLTLLEAQLGVVRRIREFIATTPTEGDGHAGRVEEPPQGWPRKGNVVLHGVCAAYDDHPVLRNASVNIRAGEKVAVVGRTGSGKSSLIQLLFGLIEKTSGLVQVDDVDLDTVSVQSLRKSFAGVPQFTFCNSQASVKANIDPNDEHSHADVVEMIRLVSAGISEYGEPEAAIDIDQLWELSKFSSSGWQQRLGIARALLRSSALYVMDEPTSGMDGKNHKVMLSNMFQRRPESTFIIVTHHNDGLDIFDKVLTVQEGDILTSKS